MSEKEQITERHLKTLSAIVIKYRPSTIMTALATAAECCAEDAARFTQLTGVEEAAYGPVMLTFAMMMRENAALMEDSLDVMRSVGHHIPEDAKSIPTDIRDTRLLATQKHNLDNINGD